MRFLQRVRIARSAERCIGYRDSVRPSVRHVPVLCPSEGVKCSALVSVAKILHIISNNLETVQYKVSYY